MLRAPRLAIADTSGTGTALVELLAGFFRSWQIPANLYADRPLATAAGPDPMAPEDLDSLSALAGVTWTPVQASTISTGGDLTILLGDLAGPLPELAAAPGAPPVLVAAAGAGEPVSKLT
ncbi:MAG: hypothetical protein ACR2N4_06320, partial [Jatrophihabitans sp.]